MKAILAAFAIFLGSTSACYATPESDALAKCLVGRSTGNDRVAMMQWLFAAMAQHPDIAEMAAISPARRVQANKLMALVVERLLTEDCVAEVKAVAGKNVGQALESAFGTLGEVAMGEITKDKVTEDAIGEFANYLNEQKFEKALGGAK